MYYFYYRFVKWRYLPFSVLVFILSLEIIVRFVSFGFSLKNVRSFSSGSAAQIVTLGESTSTENFEGVPSWPQQLKTDLESRGLKTDIINLAKPGTNSFFLVQKLKSRLLTDRPAVVVAMMGVNDAVSLKMQESFIFRHFYVARFYKWYQFLNKDDYTGNEMKNRKGQNLSETDFSLMAAGNESPLESKVTQFMKELEATSVKDTEESAKKLAISDPNNFSYIIYRTVNRLFSNMSLHQYRKFMILNRLLIERGQFDENIVYYRLYSDWSERNIAGCTEFTASMWRQYSYQFSERHLSMIANCISRADAGQRAALEPVLASQELGFDYTAVSNPAQNMTAQSYRDLYELSQTHNFRLVLMQYPLEPLDKIKAHFSPEEAQNILFVSNYENFNEALRSQKYEDLFLDRFAKTFGHPTAAGHRLIAEQLSPVVAPLIKSE